MSEYDENEDTLEAADAEHEDKPAAEESTLITFDDGRDRSISSREAERRRLEEDMKRFLNTGGQITQVDANVRTDPPRKPESNYGSRPI